MGWLNSLLKYLPAKQLEYMLDGSGVGLAVRGLTKGRGSLYRWTKTGRLTQSTKRVHLSGQRTASSRRRQSTSSVHRYAVSPTRYGVFVKRRARKHRKMRRASRNGFKRL